MTSMTTAMVGVIGGVDTHGQSHHAAVIDGVGRQLDDREFPASPAGYGALLEWLRGYGELDRVGVEGTGTYGAAFTRHLREAGAVVVEVDRPDRRARRAQGKSDPLDAYSAARAALSGAASVVPKLGEGRVEAIRALRVARSSAVKARSQATNQIKALIVTGPAQLREKPGHLPTGMIIAGCARLRPATISAMQSRPPRPRCAASHVASNGYQKKSPKPTMSLINWCTRSLRHCLPFLALGPRSPGQVLTSAGDNLNQIKSEAAFAHLCGAAPIPATPATDAHAGTDLTVAATEAPTTPSTSSFSAGSATTRW
jgi:transposase